MQTADFRSDTVTTPTPRMLKAMASAPVGDDVYFEDPTVNRLQELLAEMTGFEAGLFMPSGTMTNQVALAVHCVRGTEVIVPAGAHVYEYEPGAMAVISGLLPRVVPARHGVPAATDVRAAIQDSIHKAPTGLIVLENTHNSAGGTVVPLEYCRQVAEIAVGRNLPFHLDGARAFNAAAALGVPVAQVCEPFDSVSICLSKGLGAPVGSVLLGSRDFITRAHRYRKMLGGGMRQAGLLAAAGIVAITEMAERLSEDHVRARELAVSLSTLPGVSVDLDSVQTNMVYLRVADAADLASRLARQGVLCNALAADTIRLVTHHQITDEHVRLAQQAFTRLLDGAVHA